MMVTQKPIDGTHKTPTGKSPSKGFFVGVWIGGAVVLAVYLVLKLAGGI